MMKLYRLPSGKLVRVKPNHGKHSWTEAQENRVQRIFFNTGNADRAAFLSILQDIKPISKEINVPERIIARILQHSLGYRVPQKYEYLLKR